jgi:peptide/nickel transport system substrate-binding protein
MQFRVKNRWSPLPILILGLALMLLLALACGGAPAAPESTITTAAEPTPVSGEGETSQPTATPQATAPPAEAEVNPGKLTIMVGSLGNERFDRLFVDGTGAEIYGRILHGFLISTSEKREMVPGIASQWGFSPDGLTWTFTIRKGVKFHDGSDLTAEDVLWSLQQKFGPQAHEYIPYPTAQTVSRRMDRIEQSGPDEIKVITKQLVTDFAIYNLSEAGLTWLGHINPKRPKLWDEAQEAAYDENPIGAGIVKLVNHVPAQVMQFERFDDFYYQPKNGFSEDRRVNFQSLDLFVVPEESTRVAAMRAGEVDLAPVSLASKDQVEAGGGRLVFSPEGSVIDVRLFGCYHPQYPCNDKRVRQALDYAIDKELMRDRLLGGPEVFHVKGWSVVTPSTLGYTPEIDPWPFNPDKARQLLAEAGYPGGQGFGKLIVNTTPGSTMPLQVESAQLAAEFWRKELGLDVEVRVGESAALTKASRAGDLDGQIYWAEQQTRTDATGYIFNRYADPEYKPRISTDPELHQLVQDTVWIVDPDKRAEASKNMYLRLRDESYYLGIGYYNVPWAVGPRVLTWQPLPLALYASALHTLTLK